MPVFLFFKQIVDMFYQYQILDYGMVVLGVALLFVAAGRAWAKEKDFLQSDSCLQKQEGSKRIRLYLDDLKAFLCPSDFVVLALIIIYGISFLRYPSAYGIFFKVESCFLLYCLGRVYGRKILRHGRVLAWAGYVAVYANFVYRFYQFGFRLTVGVGEEDLLNRGGLYYYKTDLAIGMMIAVLFIYMFGENKWLKWFTITVICGYLVFYSGARMQQLMMAVEYVLILLYEAEKRTRFMLRFKKSHVTAVMAVVFVMVFLFFAALQIFPMEEWAAALNTEHGMGMVLEKLMHSRHVIWLDILGYFSECPFLTRCFGIDLKTEYLHNAKGMRAHSAYIKQLYATGYIGCILFLILIGLILYRLCEEKDRRVFYTILILWLILLGAGLTIESLESTQMSWFPMLFSGMLLSKPKKEDEETRVNEGVAVK